MILHELLAKRPPYEVGSATIPEAVRMITEASAGRLGSTDRALRGDLETIVGKALEKDKSRRYQSAADLMNDIRSFLSGRPIHARRDSGWYVLRKTMLRNKLAVALAGVIMLIGIGSAATMWSMVVEHRFAILVRDMSQTQGEVLGQLLSGADDATLDKCGAVLERLARDGEPWRLAGTAGALGYENFLRERYIQAESHLRDALQLTRDLLGERDTQTLRALQILCDNLMEQGKLDQAEEMIRQVFAKSGCTPAQTEVYAYDRFIHARLLRLAYTLGKAMHKQGRSEAAEALLRSTLEQQGRTEGAEHTDSLDTMGSLVTLLSDQGRCAEAAELARDAYELRVPISGADDACTRKAAEVLETLARAPEPID